MRNKITTYETLRQFIILSNNSSIIIKKEIIGTVLWNNKTVNDNIVYTLLFKDNKSIKCIISTNKWIDSPRIFVKKINGENYIHIIKYELNENKNITIRI